MNYIELFKESVSLNSNKTAFVDFGGERKTSYAKFDMLSSKVAGKLDKIGIKKGSFVLINIGRQTEYFAAYIGILKAGCVAVPVVSEYPKERINYIYNNCDATITVTEEFFRDIEEYEPTEKYAEENENALLVYTSGSTGTPKGILYTVKDLAKAAVRQKAIVGDIDCINHASGTLFTFAIHIFEYLTNLLLGSTIHILTEEVRHSPALTARYYEQNGITTGVITPQLLRLFKTDSKTLVRVITGSERVCDIYSDKYDIASIYGMSETAIVTKFHIDKPYNNTPLGTEFDDVKIVVCDEDGNVVKDGDEGEIYICGDFDVTYFKNEELTKETMEKMPNGTTRVHTGDIGYFNESGDLIYVNRKDWMVKINGQRVETLEIETLLAKMPQIDISAVKAFEDNNSMYLVAFYVANDEVSEDEIRSVLKAKLPDYMIPRFFVELDEMPKNQNGKLNRKALLPPKAEIYKNEYKAPENELERTICGGFEKVLKCGKVGTSDDFFALGGDSIKVLKLIEVIGIETLTPDKILKSRTPKEIAKLCSGDTAEKITHFDSILKVTPLTEAQIGVYLECAEKPQSVMYNIPMLCRLPKGTDKDRFINAVKKVAENHKALNITVGTPDGVPSMIYEEREITVTCKQIENTSKECKNFVKPFNLEKGPLYRFEIWEKGDKLYFAFDIHHIVFDGTSAASFVSQISGAYDGNPVSAEELTIFDISKFESTIKQTNEYKKAQIFFENKFDGLDCDSSIIPDAVVDTLPDTVGRITVSADKKFSLSDVIDFIKSIKITENTLFLGAFAYALAKFNGMTESLFCTVNNGRHDYRLSKSIGMFVKTLPLYYNFDETQKIADFLPQVQDDFFNTMNNDCISFGELANEYGVNTDIVFIYQAELFSGADIKEGKISVDNIETYDSQSNLDVMLINTENGYKVMAHYKESLYTRKLINSFVNLYLNVIYGMITKNTLGEIELTDHTDRKTLDKFNSTEYPYENSKTVVELFREQAKKTPDNICLVYCDKKYTYSEVDNITDILAKHLVKNGVGKEKVVGVLIPRCEHMLLCSLGILKAGGAYLPLDPTYPPERLNLMVNDSGAMMLIYAPRFKDVITDEFNGIRMSTEEMSSLKDSDIKLPTPSLNDLFVMLYTSGSTGLPKGVMFEHSNTLVTTEWVKKYFEIDENSRLTQYASYGFDAHAFDIYPAITSGAELHIISEEIRLDFPALKKYFNDNGITHTVMTTQVGRQFAQMGGFNTLKHLSVAGEKLTPPDVPEGFKLYNLYGPTEGSIITSAFLVDRKYKDVPIGKAVDNLKLYVVDKNGKMLPLGAVGELWISGAHVTRGYLNRPEKMAEAYGENTFTSQKGYERVYRTGDIVRLLGDGNLQFVGRRDAQVKVRGFRVELTEIEEVIRRFDGIKDATVAAFDEPSGGKFIVAYVVSDSEVDVDALGGFIRSEKPPYMVPAVTMQIDKIPLNQNQKVNRKALPVPKRSFGGEIVAPKNDMQQKIFDIIANVIGHNEFGINTNIYDAGLTSIGAIKLNVELSEKFDIAMKIADIKANETVEKLEQFISFAAPQENFAVLPDYPITQTQNGIFVECMSSPDTTVYNIPLLMSIGKNIDLERLATAVKVTINAHSYVKTTLFTDSEGNVRAKRNDGLEVEVPIIECAKLPGTSDLVRPFKLLDSPLYRVSLYKTDDGNYLFMDFHHIICDGTSDAVMLEDINTVYSGGTLKNESFSGFEAALEEQSVLNSSRYDKAKEYWNKLLLGCDTSCLPKKEPETNKPIAGSVSRFSDANVSEIKAYCDKNGITLNAFFNGVFSFVLSRFTGKESLTYTTVYNGRSDSRLARSVMFLAKTIPVVANFTDDTRSLDFVRDMQNQLMNSMANDACSLAELASNYGVKADIILVYQGESFKFDSMCGQKSEMIDIPSNTAKAPISVSIFIKDNKFEYTVEYRKDIYSLKFSEALIDAVSETSKAFIKTEYLRDISMLSQSGEDTYDILNDSDVDIKDIYCHRLFEQYAVSQPDKTAVIAAGETITYGELNNKANIMANALIKLGVGKENIIGLVLDRTKEVMITELAILKAGGAFLPMIPSYPDERIEFCLTNAESPFVITTKGIKEQKNELFAGDKPYKTVTVEQLLDGNNTANPDVEITPDQLAYCIYTSGSTGTPKGVMIEHHNFSNFVQTDILPLDYYRKDGFDGSALATSSISFDMSLYELYLPLCSGKTLCIATEDEFHNPLALKDLMIENKVQMMVCTPSFMNNMVSMPEFLPALKNLRTIVVGAEAFPASLYNTLRSVVPQLQIINGYGPTECTICCSTKELHSGEGITIGRPTGNMKMFVVDRFGNVLPPYGIGELIICGEGVGRGYVKLPEKNKAMFYNLRRFPAYHSGDLVRLNGNAEIEFGGRIDNQVKLRGFRIELDEIEKVMCSYSSVKQSKVLVRNNGTEDYLAGFFTAEKKVDIEELTAYMKSKLTYYMVPAVMMQLEQMPLTPNGKIDKNGFPEVKQTSVKKAGRKAPKKSLEQRLCEIFANTLGMEEIYADDNFFELGGTSLTASKVTMVLMSENIEVKYGDIFDNPTPELLAQFIEKRDAVTVNANTKSNTDSSTQRDTLKYNTVKYAPQVTREPLGNVLLTGAVGFLGIHILNELLNSEKGHIYCLVRKGSYESCEIRLKTMLIYYFSDGFQDALKNRITVIDADITDDKLGDVLRDIPFDTVINCAACVKHFSDTDILEQINVHGVENLIGVCKGKNAKLIQISTVSVPGIHTKESYEKQVRMHENELFVIDDMSNKYGISKYKAELCMYDAIDSGLRGKVIRVGNLMGRHSDGEFQANMETNMFMSGIRGFAVMGKYPISHMTDPMRFSPVDCTAKAVVLLAGTNDKFTAFNCDNRYGFDEMKIIDACNRNGITILPEKDEVYYEEFKNKLGKDGVNERLNGLAAYDIKDAHAVDTDNLFTTNILYRIGFSWPLVDDSYLDRAINSIMTLDYFNVEEDENI